LNRRNPEIGDLIIEKDKRMDGYCETRIGLVYDIKSESEILGDVFIHWFTKKPWDYYETYGYTSISIVNEYDRFDVYECR